MLYSISYILYYIKYMYIHVYICYISYREGLQAKT